MSDGDCGNESSTGDFYQVVMDGCGVYSAPYADRESAEDRAEEFENTLAGSFHVENWPNHRQEEEKVDQ